MLLRLSYVCSFLGVFGGGLWLSACTVDTPDPGNGVAGSAVGSSGSPAGGGSAGSGPGGGTTAGTANATAGSAAGGMSGGSGSVNGGAAGSAAQGGGGSASGGATSKLSAGCGKPNTDDPTAWTRHDITVTVDAKFTDTFYTQRSYWTRPPKTYDAATPIPLTIWGQGCGQGNNAEATPMTNGPAADGSLQVELLAPQGKNHCYSAGPDGDDANSPELPYFDKVLAETLANFCVDTSKIFQGGYSSGGWFSALISCNRAQKIRGVAWAAAGLQKNHDICTGPVAALITRGESDGGTPLDQTLAARDSFVMRNGCTTETKPWDPTETTFTASSCLEYQGCMPGYPVVWCPTPGGHSNGVDTGLSTKGFWKFWSTLP
jgi:poly(3-hydroxybutyrate) depolymerase